jgi:hypothetical protein
MLFLRLVSPQDPSDAVDDPDGAATIFEHGPQRLARLADVRRRPRQPAQGSASVVHDRGQRLVDLMGDRRCDRIHRHEPLPLLTALRYDRQRELRVHHGRLRQQDEQHAGCGHEGERETGIPGNVVTVADQQQEDQFQQPCPHGDQQP